MVYLAMFGFENLVCNVYSSLTGALKKKSLHSIMLVSVKKVMHKYYSQSGIL